VFHPFHLAEQMDSEEAVCVALLHDVMEDSDFTAEQIRAAGMSDAVVDALLLMTHDPAVDYMDYVRSLSGNSLARKVKMADLRHNMDADRLDSITDSDRERQEKYRAAYSLLEESDIDCEAAEKSRVVERLCYSLGDIARWLESLVEHGVDPETKVVIDRESGLEGYTYVDDLYCDADRYPDDPVVLIGSYKVRAKATEFMGRH
jgi:hypothetical protein